MKVITFNPRGYYAQKTIEASSEQEKALRLLEHRSPFAACFWAEKVEWLNNGDVVNDDEERLVARIKGEHFVIEPDHYTSPLCGLGGIKHRIQMSNGDVIETRNLWTQGGIPFELEHILCDNADFLPVYDNLIL